MRAARTALTLTRPWHWGIAIVGDPTAEIPDVEVDQVVTYGREAVIFAVRHAQDINPERYEGKPEPTTSTLHVRVLQDVEPHGRAVPLCDVVLSTPSSSITIGDAISRVEITGLGPSTRVVASASEVGLGGLEVVWIDLVSPVAS